MTLAMALGWKFENAPGICTVDGVLTEWPDNLLGPAPTLEEQEAILSEYQAAFPGPVTVLYPVDLWSRLTNAEADAVEAAMKTQPVRIQNIFRSASSYRSDHELWPMLETVAVELFGSVRASKILAASHTL